jgi:hypothetical protein
MDHERADREVWAAAERRAAVPVKLLERPTKADVRTAWLSATLFRWLKRYRERAAPAPSCRGGAAHRRAWCRLRPRFWRLSSATFSISNAAARGRGGGPGSLNGRVASATSRRRRLANWRRLRTA